MSGTRTADLPDLGAMNDGDTVLGDNGGTGNFKATAIKSYVNTGINVPGSIALANETSARIAADGVEATARAAGDAAEAAARVALQSVVAANASSFNGTSVAATVVGVNGPTFLVGAVTLGTTVTNLIPSVTPGWAFALGGEAQGYSNSVPLSLGTGAPGGGSIINLCYGAAVVGVIATDGTGTTYNTTSDYRLKVTFGHITAANWIDQVPVHSAAFKDRLADRRPMFMAHELQAFAPWAVMGERDAVDAGGEIIPQMINPGALIPVLWAEIQALRRRVSQLEISR